MKKVLTVAAVAGFAPTLAMGQLEPNWSRATDRITMGSPRLADINGDGAAEIILATMGFVGAAYDSGALFVFDLDGEPAPGFPIDVPLPIVSPPAVGDI